MSEKNKEVTVLLYLIWQMLGEGCVCVHDEDKNLIDSFIQRAEKLLELEKKQIIDAYWAGLNGSINDYSECKTFGDENTIIGGAAEKYYNDTYKRNVFEMNHSVDPNNDDLPF